MKKIGKIIAALLGAIVLIYIFLAGLGPETYVISGKEIPKKYMQVIRDLGLIEEGENVQLFYSDAFYNIKDGMYFLTEKRLVIYSRDWTTEKVSTLFSEIVEIVPEIGNSSWDDSVIWVSTKNAGELRVPVSNEDGGSERFYEYLKKKYEQIIE